MSHRKKIYLLSLFACLLCTTSIAQENKENWWKRTWVYKVDHALTKWYFSAKTDTQYVVRPKTKWILKGVENLCGSSACLRGSHNGEPFHTDLTPSYKSTISAGIDYLGLFVGLSANPAKWKGKYSDYEFNFSLYTNRLGIDFMFHNQKSAGGWLQNGDNNKIDIPNGSFHSKTFNVNTFYAFNSKRFSIPATAFSQSFIQKRSAGSWLMGLSFVGQWAEPEKDAATVLPINKYKSLNLSLGAGYGYNLVLSKNFTFHASALPTLILWNKTSIWDGTEWKNSQSHFPDFHIVGRASLVGNFNRYVAGITCVGTFSALGEASRFQANTAKWRARIHFGWRF